MLIIKDLNIGFSKQPILKNINLSLEAGKIYGVLGLNGAGKTTLFRTIYGFYTTPQGAISFNQKQMTKHDISFLETENYFYPYIKGLEYLQLATEGKVADEEIKQWNELFELPLNDLTDTYSTGMRKKLAFLGVLLQKRPIIILDEPFNGIDLETSERLFVIVRRLKESGKIILLSSHIMSALIHLCDEIAHLKEGIVVKMYQPHEFESLQTTIQQRIEQQMQDHFTHLVV
jgi:ABC-2 type transport system ATP-binding protein